MKTPAPHLTTQRLLLREITREDTDNIVAWRSDPQVYRYFISAHALKEEEHLAWYMQRYLFDEKRYDFMACCMETNTPIGVFGVKWWQDTPEIVEISYLVAPRAKRKGYAREAVAALLDWTVEYWHSRKAIAEIHRDNIASIRLVESMGFLQTRQDGRFIVYERLL